MGATGTRKTSEVVDIDKAEARRARKRVTDRKSQRHHRDRQRAYVKQLEATVKSYEASYSQSGSGDASALLNEVEKLRARCRSLESTLDRIKSLADGLDVEAACSSRSSPEDHDPATQNGKQATGVSFDSHHDHSKAEDLTAPDTWRMDGLPVFATDEESVLAFHLAGNSAPDLPKELNDMGLLGESVDLTKNSTIARESAACGGPPSAVGHGQPTGSEEEPVKYPSPVDDFEGYLISLDNGGIINQDLTPAPALMRDGPLPLVPVNMRLSQEGMGDTIHLRFPNTSAPACQWDRFLLSVIDDARTQLRLGHFPVAEAPSLRAVLSDKSADILASRLYNYLCSYGNMPLHLFLGVLWVQYLFLRWHVVGTRAAYLQMPEFMRPTGLETRIAHQPCVGMLVWPDVRRALIRDSHMTDPSHIGTELLQHLSYSWSPTAHITGDLIGSTDVLKIIEHQACQAETWKVDPSFQKKYPQFASCRFV